MINSGHDCDQGYYDKVNWDVKTYLWYFSLGLDYGLYKKEIVSWVQTFTALYFLTRDKMWPATSSSSSHHDFPIIRAVTSNCEPKQTLSPLRCICQVFDVTSSKSTKTDDSLIW